MLTDDDIRLLAVAAVRMLIALAVASFALLAVAVAANVLFGSPFGTVAASACLIGGVLVAWRSSRC